MLTYHLTVKVKKFLKSQKKISKYGYIDPKSNTRYVIYINSDYPLFEVIGTLFHELSHFVLFTVFKDVFTSKREEDFCYNMDRHAQAELKELTESKEEDE